MRNKVPENEDTPWVVEMEYEVGKNNEIIYLRIFMTMRIFMIFHFYYPWCINLGTPLHGFLLQVYIIYI